MQIVDGPRFPEFDPTPFVSYDNEDDKTPTEAELVEELPEYELPPALKAIAEGKPLEKPLRRGVGYLRAESAPDTDSSNAPADSEPAGEFGEGIDTQTARDLDVPGHTDSEPASSGDGNVSVKQDDKTEEPLARLGTETSSPDADSQTGDKPRSGRKRRRRSRRRRGKRDGADSSSPRNDNAGAVERPDSSTTSLSSEADGASQQLPSGSTNQPTGDADRKTKPKRNRRRRRRRRGGSGGGTGDAPKPPAE